MLIPHTQVDGAGLVRDPHGSHLVSVFGRVRLRHLQHDHMQVHGLLIRLQVLDEEEAALVGVVVVADG